uniref:Calcium homeostasis modulator family member 4 n=1 Tax=Apteryx owenii TaxID=8824 RepID=A0A8B9PAI3_APTOW
MTNPFQLFRKEVIIANAIIAILTIGGQQLFSFFMFSCPCHVGQNLIYGLAFLGVPALILLIVGYALNNQTWRLVTGKRSPLQQEGTRNHLLQCKLTCFVLSSITGRALVAPVTWLAVTLINGSFYVCAVSEYVSMYYFGGNPNITASERRKILAAFPCSQLVPPELSRARDEVILLLRYQSQVSSLFITVFLSYCLASCFSPLSFLHFRYWTKYVHNEQELFDEAMDQHSRLYAMQHVRKFFGFAPGTRRCRVRSATRPGPAAGSARRAGAREERPAALLGQGPAADPLPLRSVCWDLAGALPHFQRRSLNSLFSSLHFSFLFFFLGGGCPFSRDFTLSFQLSPTAVSTKFL